MGVGPLYQALYRKWRPKVFGDVSGQPGITQTLKNEIAASRIAHAYLFTGSRGTGKTTCAKIFAKAVNCLNPQGGEPCNECANCVGIDDGSILDVVEIDAASNNGVDSIRELREETVYTPANAKYRVYIIDEAHMLSTGAFNALLKTLEEPPSYVIFILATTEAHKIPATIASRCQRFDFRRIPAADIAARLEYVAKQENIALESGAADMIARISDGALRNALSLLDQCAGSGEKVDENKVSEAAGLTGRDYLFEISKAVMNRDSGAALGVINRLYSSAKNVERLCQELILHFRDLMIVKSVKDPFEIISCRPDEKDRLSETAGGFSLEALIHALDTLQSSLVLLKNTSSGRTYMETCIIKLCCPQLDTSPSALLRRIEALEEKLSFGISTPPAAVSKPHDSESDGASVTADNNVGLDKPPFTGKPADSVAASQKEQTEPQINTGLSEDAVAAKPAKSQIEPSVMPQQQGLPSSDPSADVNLDCWPEILEALKKADMPLYGVLSESSAIIRGGFVLIDPNNGLFAGLIRSQEHQRPLVDVIRRVTGKQYKVGIFKRGLVSPKKQEYDGLDEIAGNAGSLGIKVTEK